MSFSIRWTGIVLLCSCQPHGVDHLRQRVARGLGSADDRPRTRPPMPRESFDEPDQAAIYQRMKRQGPSPDFDTAAAYRAAHAHRDAMPRHSTRLGGPVPRMQSTEKAPKKNFVAARALGQWEPLGPGNIGGRTRTLVIHPTQPDIMYAGGVSGGVWKTTDAGQTWTPLADRIANIAVNSMAIHPTNPDVLYVGTGEGYFREIVRGTWLPLRGAGIFKTEDGGTTWSQIPSTDKPAFHWVNDLIISLKDPDRIYAATRAGVHISENGGRSWSQSLDPEVNGGCLDLALRTDLAADWLFASCGTFDQSTVYRRRMAADEEWETVLSEPGHGPHQSRHCAVQPVGHLCPLRIRTIPDPNRRQFRDRPFMRSIDPPAQARREPGGSRVDKDRSRKDQHPHIDQPDGRFLCRLRVG